MCATFTDDEIGKSVVNDADEEVGIVTSVEGDIAHVRPATDVVDSIKSSIGWDGVAEATQPLESDTVCDITDEAVQLEGDLPTADEASTVDAGDGDTAAQTEPAGGSAGIQETDVAGDLRDETDEETLEETDTLDTNEASDGSTRAHRPDETDASERSRGLEDGVEQERLTDHETDSNETDSEDDAER